MAYGETDTKRRGFLRRAAASAGALALSAAVPAGSAFALSKESKQLAHYQDHPNGAALCANCIQFMAPSSCKVVAGNISPNGWCALYQPVGKTGG